jgi:hypothetical protein
MRGVPVLASDSGYYPRSGMLPLAQSLGRSNLRSQLAEIMPAILWLQRMISHYSIEPCRITVGNLKAEQPLLIDSWLLSRPGYPAE